MSWRTWLKVLLGEAMCKLHCAQFEQEQLHV